MNDLEDKQRLKAVFQLSDGMKSIADRCQLDFVAPGAKVMMEHLLAIGFGLFKIYKVESRN